MSGVFGDYLYIYGGYGPDGYHLHDFFRFHFGSPSFPSHLRTPSHRRKVLILISKELSDGRNSRSKRTIALVVATAALGLCTMYVLPSLALFPLLRKIFFELPFPISLICRESFMSTVVRAPRASITPTCGLSILVRRSSLAFTLSLPLISLLWSIPSYLIS